MAVSRALAGGANPKKTGRLGMTVLMLAAKGERAEALGILIPVSDVSACDDLGWSALMTACDRGAIQCAFALMAAGANPNGGYRGMTPLSLAVAAKPARRSAGLVAALIPGGRIEPAFRGGPSIEDLILDAGWGDDEGWLLRAARDERARGD